MLKNLLFTDIDLKVAAKFFGSKFACGSSVTGDDEIVIQGDVKDDLFEVIPEKWPQVSFERRRKAVRCKSGKFLFLTENPVLFQIDEDSIDDLGDQKR